MMKRKIRNAVGRPDNSVFIRRCIIYGILLAVMLFGAPILFEKWMVPMAADGMTTAWNVVFVPVAVFMMLIGLFRAWRRRWSLAYMHRYQSEVRANGYETCPRCGSPVVMKKRNRFRREKTGELVTTTTYTDGSKTVDRKDIYGNVKYTECYHVCTNGVCKLEAEQSLSQSHLPWKIKEIAALVLNDSRLLGRKHPSASSVLLSRLLVPFLALVIVVIGGITVYTYADSHNDVWVYTVADKDSARSAEEYQNYLLSLDTQYPHWYMSYEKAPTDMLNYLLKRIPGQDKEIGYSMNCYTGESGTTFTYRFKGDDAGTGIPDGWYTLTTLDGVKVLIDDTNEQIYKQGSEFYETYAPKLLALSHDGALRTVLERTNGGEHAMAGANDFWKEYLRKDGTMVYSYMMPDDETAINGGFHAVTNYPDEQMRERWSFNYDEYEYPADDLEGYVYSDAAPRDESDELGKLIAKSVDDSGEYTRYRNGEEVVNIDIDYLANGYEFRFDTLAQGECEGFELDVAYRVNTNTKTMTKIVTDEHYVETEHEMPLSEYQAQYDFLMSVLPEPYIRKIIDLDKAEKRKEKMGLITVYEMKDANGNVTADLKLMFGRIGEAVHYISENEYVKIELEL